LTQELSKTKVKMGEDGSDFVEKVKECTKTKCCKICGNIVVGILFSSISLASLIIGIQGIDDCRIKKLIPVWLIVYGALGLARSALSVLAVR
jgi:hypothetical protein